jgi:GH15 family glucan-1,4-alpha-glucosidase
MGEHAAKISKLLGQQAAIANFGSSAQILAEVCEMAFDRYIAAFVRAYGSKQLDASALLIPAVGFLPPTDARVKGPVEANERSLMSNGCVLPYDTGTSGDGLPRERALF